jgi:hypothetical protein
MQAHIACVLDLVLGTLFAPSMCIFVQRHMPNSNMVAPWAATHATKQSKLISTHGRKKLRMLSNDLENIAQRPFWPAPQVGSDPKNP